MIRGVLKHEDLIEKDYGKEEEDKLDSLTDLYQF